MLVRVIVSWALLSGIDCVKILGLSNFPSKSHYILYDTLFKALAARGHEVTVISPFPSAQVNLNLEYIQLIEASPGVSENLAKIASKRRTTWYHYFRIMTLHYFHELTESAMKGSTIKNLLRANKKFDLIILDYALNDALIALAWHYRAPIILLGTTSGHQLMNFPFYNPSPYSYVPDALQGLPSMMTFYQRMSNTIDSTILELMYNLYFLPKQQYLLQDVLPKAPKLATLHQNISLILLNSHHSIESPRPYVPGMVQIGGFHAEAPNELKNDTRAFLDEADEGVIFISLGSITNHLPKDTFHLFLDAFSTLPFRVLWKFNNPNITSIPPNVFIKSWVSQRDVLAHRNVKLFITHGGLGSITEAVYHAVPMVGIPLFADQLSNVAEGSYNKYMYKLLFENISKKSLTKAVMTVLDDRSYTKNVKIRSAILRDQPLKPLNNAIYWVEYVIRHEGAHHLKTYAMKLPWYKYYLLDIVGFLAVVILFFIVLIVYFLRGFRIICKGLTSAKMKKE